MKETLEKLIDVVQTVLNQQGGLVNQATNGSYNLTGILEEARVTLAKVNVIADHYQEKIDDIHERWTKNSASFEKTIIKLEAQRDTYHEMWYEEAKKNVNLEQKHKPLQDRLDKVHKIRAITMSAGQPAVSTISSNWKDCYFDTLRRITEITSEIV